MLQLRELFLSFLPSKPRVKPSKQQMDWLFLEYVSYDNRNRRSTNVPRFCIAICQYLSEKILVISKYNRCDSNVQSGVVELIGSRECPLGCWIYVATNEKP